MVPGLTDEHEARIADAWPAILAHVEAGGQIQEALAEHAISKTSLRRWRIAAPERTRELQEAVRDSADVLRDEHLETLRNSDIDPALMRARLSGLEWQMKQRDPDRYADRSRHDINVKTLDLGPILARAEARLAAQRVIEGEVIRPMLDAAQQSDDSELELAKSLF
jgi:hypothetical protein